VRAAYPASNVINSRALLECHSRAAARIPAFGVSRFGEDLAKCCDKNFSLATRSGVTDFAAQSLVRQVLNVLRGLFIYVRLTTIFAHARGYVGDE
jgi:hypothetical protein